MQELFELGRDEFIALDKLLKATGVCSTGGSARVAISEGRVCVDGQVELRKRCKIRSGQTVELEDQQITVQ